MAITDAVLNELIKDYQKPEDLLGKNGLFKQLLDQLRVFRLRQNLLNGEGTMHPHCHNRFRALCPVLSSGASAGLGWRMTRYADDFIVQCPTREEAETALRTIREWMEAAGLTLHPEKTRIVDATTRGGFDFLGWHFERGFKWPRVM